jgi:glycine/D-amino acid oxidase-like deaminating enzyme
VVCPCLSAELPVIGRTAKFDNLYFATGHGMLGLTLAPVTGKRIVALPEGSQCADDEDLLGPDRFPLS